MVDDSAESASREFEWSQHIGLLAGVVLTLGIALRFLAMASYNTVTAAAMLQALGPGNAVLGTLVVEVPLGVGILTGALVGVTLYRWLALGVRLGVVAVVLAVWSVLVLALFPSFTYILALIA